MPSYWWQCEQCGCTETFKNLVQCSSLPAFLWDNLVPSGWDQSLLVRPCSRSGCSFHFRITYDFPRSNKETPMVVRIVGLNKPPDTYLAMLWETYFLSDPSTRLFDFKYVNGRSPFGLNKPAVFTQQDLTTLFALYGRKAGIPAFP